MGPRPKKQKLNKIARTKWGIYSYPSLYIAENQEQRFQILPHKGFEIVPHKGFEIYLSGYLLGLTFDC